MSKGSQDEARSRSANWMLGVAAGCVALSVLAFSGGIAWHFIGYALASLFAFTLIAMFRRRTVERSMALGVGVPHWIKRTAVGVLLLGLAVSIVHSWFIASYYS